MKMKSSFFGYLPTSLRDTEEEDVTQSVKLKDGKNQSGSSGTTSSLEEFQLSIAIQKRQTRPFHEKGIVLLQGACINGNTKNLQ